MFNWVRLLKSACHYEINCCSQYGFNRRGIIMAIELNPTLGSLIEIIKDHDKNGVISNGDEIRIVTEDEKIIDGTVQYINMRHPEVTTIILLGKDNKQYSFTTRKIDKNLYGKMVKKLYDITNFMELNLLWLYARDTQGDTKVYKDILDRVVSLAKETGIEKMNKNKKMVAGHAHSNLGDLKQKNGDYDGAIENYKKALVYYGDDMKQEQKAELNNLINKCKAAKNDTC